MSVNESIFNRIQQHNAAQPAGRKSIPDKIASYLATEEDAALPRNPGKPRAPAPATTNRGNPMPNMTDFNRAQDAAKRETEAMAFLQNKFRCPPMLGAHRTDLKRTPREAEADYPAVGGEHALPLIDPKTGHGRHPVSGRSRVGSWPWGDRVSTFSTRVGARRNRDRKAEAVQPELRRSHGPCHGGGGRRYAVLCVRNRRETSRTTTLLLLRSRA
ncbi:hypothetical protein T484DRAFT_3157954 [Baffinella frigidus]|nr:hypothetical protein T484DRAFT_3157954 [Cryptophyta sp. CCMP2293]